MMKTTDYEMVTKMNQLIQRLRKSELQEAYSDIMIMLLEYPNCAEPHNLLGIWYELHGNYELAKKHYRAGYALDPSYLPASNNLERLCIVTFEKKRVIDYGEKLHG